MESHCKRKDLVYHAYFAMKNYCEENDIHILDTRDSLNKLYELNSVLNSPNLGYFLVKEDDCEYYEEVLLPPSANSREEITTTVVEINENVDYKNLSIDEWLNKYNIYKLNKK